MANIKLLIPKILKWEGGFSNDPNDAGGATMKGVTIATFRHYYGSSRTVAELKAITDSQWSNIFKKGYWDKVLGDSILSQSVANLLCDWVWMSGVTTPVKNIQRIVGVKDDGQFGPKTLAAVNGMNARNLFDRLMDKRVLYYDCIIQLWPSNAKFKKGWMNRLNDYKFTD